MRKIFVEGFGTIGVDDGATDDDIGAAVEEFKTTKGKPTPITLGPEGTQEQLRKMGEEMGPAQSMLTGVQAGLGKLAHAALGSTGIWPKEKTGESAEALSSVLAGTPKFRVPIGTGSARLPLGEVADLATQVGVTGPAIAGASRALPAAVAKWSAANPAKAAGAAGAATGAALTPGDLGEKAVGAGVGGALPLATTGVLKAATGLVKKVNPAAKRLMQVGVPVPWGRASSSKLVKEAQKIGEKQLPYVDTQKDVLETTLREAGKRATPPGMKDLDMVPGRGNYFIKLEGQYDKAYDNLLKGQIIPTGESLRSNLAGIADSQADDAVTKGVHRWLGNQKTLQGDAVTGREWKDLQIELRRQIRGAYGSEKGKSLGDALTEIDDALIGARNAGVPKKVASMLDRTDQAYAHGAILEQAASYKAAAKEGITPETFLQATERAPKRIKAQGIERYGDLSRPLAKVSEKSDVPWWVARGAGLVGAPFSAGMSLAPSAIALSGKSAAVNRLMMGQYPKQQALADWLRRTAPALGAAEGAVLPILKD